MVNQPADQLAGLIRSGWSQKLVYSDTDIPASQTELKGQLQVLNQPPLASYFWIEILNVVDTPSIQFKLWACNPKFPSNDKLAFVSTGGPIAANGVFLVVLGANLDIGAIDEQYAADNILVPPYYKAGLVTGAGTGTPTFDANIWHLHYPRSARY